ncbi:MAG: class I SAM-dependent methyltransferase [Phycisphaerales bacterium]
MTLSPDYQRDWTRYFDCTADKPPRDTLLRALDALGDVHNRTALDIACGVGRDSIEMLRRGMRVIATDFQPEAIERLRACAGPESSHRLATVTCAMEDIPTTGDLRHSYTLINASFALPFCHESRFGALWDFIKCSLIPGGVFAGQLFGDRDQWASINPGRHLSSHRVKSLLADFRTVHFEEVEKDGDDAMGGTKHHHVYHIVAMKPVHPAKEFVT